MSGARVRGAVAALAAAAAALGLGWLASAETPSERLTADEVRELITDAELQGCYPDGSPWAERTEAGGALYDLLQGDGAGEIVGRWWLEDDIVCYSYDIVPQFASCFFVMRRGRHLDFHIIQTGELGGTTDCGLEVAGLSATAAHA